MLKNFILFFVIISFSCSSSEVEVNKITSEKLISLLKTQDIQLIDVRMLGEYNVGHIEGALNIDFYKSSFVDSVNELDKSKLTVVYCKSGNRSNKSALIMDSLGFIEIYDFNKGMNGWLKTENSIVRLDSLN
jgi:rhodanese-related sulfurtransferase